MKTAVRAITKKLMPMAFILAAVLLLAPASAQAAKKPGKVTKLEEVKATDKSVTVKFKKVKGAKKYQVRVYKATCRIEKKAGADGRKTRVYKWTTGKKLVKKMETKKTQFTVKGLKKGKWYAFKVRAFNGKSYGKWETQWIATTRNGIHGPGESKATGNNLKKQYEAWLNYYARQAKKAASDKKELAGLMDRPISLKADQFECTGKEMRNLENFQEYDAKSVHQTYKTGKGTDLELYRIIQEMCKKCGIRGEIQKSVVTGDGGGGAKTASYTAVAYYDERNGRWFSISAGSTGSGDYAGSGPLPGMSYVITYAAVDGENRPVTFNNNPGNKTSYTQQDTPMTILNASKEGWVFDGWTQTLGRAFYPPGLENCAAKKDGTSDELKKITINPSIDEGSWGQRHYVAHFHKPRYTVMHKYERLDGGWDYDWSETNQALIGELVTPAVSNREGFTFQGQPQTVAVAADSSTTVVYEYKRNSYECTVIDIADKDTKNEKILGQRDIGLKKYGSAITDEDIGGTGAEPNAYHAGYTFTKREGPTNVLARKNTVYRYFISGDASGRYPYTVRHWLLDKNQERISPVFAEDKGTISTGESLLPHVRTHAEGVPSSNEIPAQLPYTVDFENNVIDIEYPYKEYTVQCYDYIYDEGGVYNSSNWIGNASGETKKVSYGDSVAGSDFGHDGTLGSYYGNCIYVSCSEETANDESSNSEGIITVRRYFKEMKGEYTVVHRYHQLDESVLEETVERKLQGAVGDWEDAPVKEKTGYVMPDVQRVTKQADGTVSPNPVIYDYYLKSCEVQYIDLVKGTVTQLGDAVHGTAIFGSTIDAGFELGTNKEISYYHEGYMYDSCTTAVVKETGTVAYRYFTDMHVAYTVMHRLQNAKDKNRFDVPDDGFDDKTGIKGETVTEYPRTKYESMGYLMPEPQTVTLEDDTLIIFNYLLDDLDSAAQ